MTPRVSRRFALLAPLPPLLVFVLPARSDAAQVTNERVPFALTVTNPCTGEAVVDLIRVDTECR